MPKLEETIVHFTRAYKSVSGSRRTNKAYKELRREAERILEQYKENQLDTALLQECTNLVRRMENLNASKLSNINYMRSRSNIVYISAMAKRTHYAAYMAGVWSGDGSISKPFKAWMHNSAADGAISLYEATYPFIRNAEDNASRRVLAIFAEAAILDAEVFLEMSDRQFPECAVTRYNRARADIYHVERDRVRQGVQSLLSIPSPSESSEAPELIWHKDNFESFANDKLMRERIELETPENLARADEALRKNFDAAQLELDKRRDELWEPYRPYAKAALVGMATGSVAILYAILGDASLMDLIGLANAHGEVIMAAQESYDELIGGGGMANLDFKRVIGFGGGGLA